MVNMLCFEKSDLETINSMYDILDAMVSNVLYNHDITEPFTGVTYNFGDTSLDGKTMEKFYNFIDELHRTLFIGDRFGCRIDGEGEENTDE